MGSNDNSNPSASPVPDVGNAQVLMDWYDAMREVSNGKRVTRREWGNEKVYIFLQEDHLRIAFDNGTVSNLITRGVDITAEDWFTV